jgi:hypothetical protein
MIQYRKKGGMTGHDHGTCNQFNYYRYRTYPQRCDHFKGIFL